MISNSHYFLALTSLLLALAAGTTTSSSSSSSLACQDDPRFRFQGVPGYTCDWIAEQDDNLCDWEVLDDEYEYYSDEEEETTTSTLSFVPKTIGMTHCPVSCGRCARQVETSSVTTDNICYDANSSHSSHQRGVVVSFENQDPKERDWVGIYPALTTTEDSLEPGSTLETEPIAYSWLCDVGIGRDNDNVGVPNTNSHHDISTSCKAEYNQVVFRQLPPGIYQAVLVRWDDEIYAASPSFFEVLGPNRSGSELCSQRRLNLSLPVDGETSSSFSSSSDEEDREHETSPDEEEEDHGCDRLNVDRLTYNVGQDIPLQLEQCPELSQQPGDFVAIYNADTDWEDIKGDANYRLWMWTCGSQSCRHHEYSNDDDDLEIALVEVSSTSSSLTFGKESNKHSWPLPPGSYQAHLVRHLVHEDRFASVAQSAVFEIQQEEDDEATTTTSSSIMMMPVQTQTKKKTRRQLEDCLDVIRAKEHCYQEGDNFSVLFRNECGILDGEDWFGFFAAEDCSEVDQICQGEPIIWSLACNSSSDNHHHHCHNRAGHVEYHFQGRRRRANDDRGEDEEQEPDFTLPAGDYRVVLVAEKDNADNEDHGPYFARVISKPMEVHRKGDSCHLIEQQM